MWNKSAAGYWHRMVKYKKISVYELNSNQIQFGIIRKEF